MTLKMARTPLVYLCDQAREDGHKDLADRCDEMAQLLARSAGELVALGCDADEMGSVLYDIHDMLGYT